MHEHLVYEPVTDFVTSFFSQKFDFLNEMALVEIVQKTWYTVLRVGELFPVTKQKDPNLRIIFLIRYKFETLP